MASASAHAKLRLNLLPPEIPAARRAKRLFPLCIILILASVGGSLFWMLAWSNAAKTRQDELSKAQAAAQKVTELEQEITAEQAKRAPLQAIVQFLDDFETHSAKYADVVEALAHYVPDTCTLDRISITGSSVSFSTVVEDTESLIRLVINLNRAGMPAEGGGTEPLWSDDAVSRGKLKPLFAGPISVSGVNVSGGTFETDVYPEGDLRAQLMSFGPTPTGVPSVSPGGSVYRHGVVWQAPIPVTITATLAEPVGLELPAAAAGGQAAPAGASPMGGMPSPGGAGPAGSGGAGPASTGGGAAGSGGGAK